MFSVKTLVRETEVSTISFLVDHLFYYRDSANKNIRRIEKIDTQPETGAGQVLVVGWKWWNDGPQLAKDKKGYHYLRYGEPTAIWILHHRPNYCDNSDPQYIAGIDCFPT